MEKNKTKKNKTKKKQKKKKNRNFSEILDTSTPQPLYNTIVGVRSINRVS